MPNNYSVVGQHDKQIATIGRIGTVTDVKDTAAKVKIGNITTDYFPWLHQRATDDYDWWQPQKEEQVVVLQIWGDPSFGVILGALPQKNYKKPVEKDEQWGKRFRDGTLLTYDPKKHLLNVKMVDDSNNKSGITIVCDKATVKASDGVTLDTPKTHCTGDVKADGDVKAGDISLRHHTHTYNPGMGSPTETSQSE